MIGGVAVAGDASSVKLSRHAAKPCVNWVAMISGEGPCGSARTVLGRCFTVAGRGEYAKVGTKVRSLCFDGPNWSAP